MCNFLIESFCSTFATLAVQYPDRNGGKGRKRLLPFAAVETAIEPTGGGVHFGAVGKNFNLALFSVFLCRGDLFAVLRMNAGGRDAAHARNRDGGEQPVHG